MRQWLIDKGGIYVVVQFALFGALALAPAKIGWEWAGLVGIFGRTIGSILFLYGIIMVGLGMLNLGRNLQAEPHPKEDATLITNGAYRLVRHPIYSGIILGWTGWEMLKTHELTSILALALLFLFFDIKTRREERMLVAKFPAYADYQTRVRKLIPYIY